MARRIDTREEILIAAERLFALNGIASVSNRQISEVAGLGDNSAVGYHFGAKSELVLAILRKHTSPMEWTRAQLVSSIGDSTDVRDWITCLVQPTTRHFAAQGENSYFARFSAQLIYDPALHPLLFDEALISEPLMRVVEGIDATTNLSVRARTARQNMSRHLIVQACAEQEGALDGKWDGAGTIPTWAELSDEITDALVGLWSGPSTDTTSTFPVRDAVLARPVES